MTWRRHVRIDSSVSSVSPSSHLSSSIDLDMLDDQSIDVQTLVVSIGLSILKQIQQVSSTLLRPTTLSTASLDLWVPSYSSIESAEWYCFLLVDDIV